MPKDHYIILGVSRNADPKRIKKAYRTIVKKVHPDINRSGENVEKFMEAREAYETLGDEDRRRKYDEELAGRDRSRKTTRPPEEGMTHRSLYDEMEDAFSTHADEFFEGFIPGFFDIHKGRLREKDLFFEAILSPGEAERGGQYPLSLPVIEPCPRCDKTGIWDDLFCPQCSGYGRVRSERVFTLIIPPRVSHGDQIRISLEDIGLRNVHLTVIVRIDPFSTE
jgi:molecular chaperone DnaJ